MAKIVSDFTLKFIQSDATSISMMSASSTPEHDLLHQEVISNFIMLTGAKFTYRIFDRSMHFSRRHTFYIFLFETYKDFE